MEFSSVLSILTRIWDFIYRPSSEVDPTSRISGTTIISTADFLIIFFFKCQETAN